MKKGMMQILLAAGVGFFLTGCMPEMTAGRSEDTCMIEECTEKTYEHGLCQEHYRLVYETEEPKSEGREMTDGQAENTTEDEPLTPQLESTALRQEQPIPQQEPTSAPSAWQVPSAETTVQAEAKIETGWQERAADTMEEEIRYIREVYTYANNDQNLRQKNGYDSDYGVFFEDGFSYYDEDGNLIKLRRENGYNGIQVEAYFINPALGRSLPDDESLYLDTIIVFAFATDGNGGEYRLYFNNGNVIRYIGPDKQVVDFPYPKGINWMEFNRMSDRLSGGDNIWNILAMLSPMWWIPYETSGE